ncbi:metal-dependent hydrolase [Larsenimonas suaedae]|uniref:Metal-dependent hydrolase n=1 Tax=Larsenimonas suaedae TaxID=1851019 RepID=A0ABU1GQY7_9GAMM|nr:metal-dependent hydrolase [Larsenimonas suaedae]MCM2972750.1 metal-dependent hydrolase [Larsenimonas suaedae]MDR5894453.1 metal-dependent hydrolase [Larsenimonas suaedae]
MANFNTHLGVATVGGVVTAGLGFQAGLWPWTNAFTVAGLVALGGILPDIDSDNSHAIRLMFTVLAILGVVISIGMYQSRLPMPWLLGLGAGTFLAIRYLGSAIFKRFSVHRGIWHSLLAAAVSGAAVSGLSYQLFQQPPTQAWCHGVALFVGACIHLLLDECYSIDLAGTRIKRSFGTAFKLFDYGSPATAVLMLLAFASLTPWLPPTEALLALVQHTWSLFVT